MDFTPRLYETSGSAVIGGRQVDYRTECGDWPVYAEDGGLLGTMFSYAYLSTSQEDSQRPVVFAFNGGPGSSSLWLHAGFLAPETVKMPNPLNPPTMPPYALEPNDECILDVSDIVLIDPMGTGYGLVLNEERQGEAYSIESDAKIFAQFIESWKISHGRENSPVYLLAESYGTLRACTIPDMLIGGPTTAVAETRGYSVNGIILMGSAVAWNPGKMAFFEGSVEQMTLAFPTMAACSWYFTEGEKPDLDKYMDEAYAFAGGDLLRSLYAGYSMPEDEREKIISRLTYFTGLDPQLIRQNNCRISAEEFASRRLASQGLDLGLYDGRFTMPHSGQLGFMAEPTADDPAMGAYVPAYCGAFALMAKKLGIRIAEPYKAINFKINSRWSYEGRKTPAEHLQAALRRSPGLQVMFCCGRYDFVTTPGQARYLANHLDCAGRRVLVRDYESGHMPYIGSSRRDLARDIRTMISEVSG